jgi:hypothetical protein
VVVVIVIVVVMMLVIVEIVYLPEQMLPVPWHSLFSDADMHSRFWVEFRT